ncbi:MAG TPA: gephyrin-like molybdotransferase Glp [Rhizomicrobium sp.]
MITVDQAVARISGAFAPVGSERVALGEAAGRVLARDAYAMADQPPAAVSAMDGYAVRLCDADRAGATLRMIGESPAGHPFGGRINAGEAVRIFTGAVVPEGADAILIQENAKAHGNDVVSANTASRKHIRPAGLDFGSGSVLAVAGRRLTARDLSLLAAGDIAALDVRRKPRIAFAATGDELSRPGEPRKPGGIVASAGYGLSTLLASWGGEAHDLGILPDRAEAIAALPALAAGADLIVTLGGASVGDHDLVRSALEPKGFVLDFWKIAMRPGKPLIFGRLGATPFIGLPGNPVSALVCALLFVRPAVAAMLGVREDRSLQTARTERVLSANDSRQDYLRATLFLRDGELWTDVMLVQDSSMLSAFAAADCLIVRAPHAPAAQAGDNVAVLRLDET